MVGLGACHPGVWGPAVVGLGVWGPTVVDLGDIEPQTKLLEGLSWVQLTQKQIQLLKA